MMTKVSTYFIPFIPQRFNLDRGTIALNATHYDATTARYLQEYDVHALFGHMQAKVTMETLTKANWTTQPNPIADHRKYITSKSTYAGSGQYAQHFLDRTKRSWQQMELTVAHLMNQNMFGI